MSDTDSRVQQYEAKFNELKLGFQGRAIVQTEITVVRIMDSVENISESYKHLSFISYLIRSMSR